MQQVRSLFLSDIHLGTRACQADHLLEFLRDYQAEPTYLIGDIVDFWAMHRSICWLPSHNTVVRERETHPGRHRAGRDRPRPRC